MNIVNDCSFAQVSRPRRVVPARLRRLRDGHNRVDLFSEDMQSTESEFMLQLL